MSLASVLVVHSNDKDVGALRQSDLPIDDWKLDIEAAMSTSSQNIFVIVSILASSFRCPARSDWYLIIGHVGNGGCD